MTSSISSVHGFPPSNGTHYTEKDWNERHISIKSPYNWAKTEAEKLAWKLTEEQSSDSPKFELVTILPGFSLGPLYHKQHLSSSPGVRTCRFFSV